jgi:hypothetical protein
MDFNTKDDVATFAFELLYLSKRALCTIRVPSGKPDGMPPDSAPRRSCVELLLALAQDRRLHGGIKNVNVAFRAIQYLRLKADLVL